MATYPQQMQEIFRQYQKEVGVDPVDLKAVGAWAVAKKLWAPRPVDIHLQFARDMADALREEYRTDQKGRRYRSKLAVTTQSEGKQGSLWGDTDTAPRSHVVKSVAQRRRGIVSDCFQLRVDVDHYNDDHPKEEKIQLVLDFRDDIEEMLVSEGLDDEKAA